MTTPTAKPPPQQHSRSSKIVLQQRDFYRPSQRAPYLSGSLTDLTGEGSDGDGGGAAGSRRNRAPSSSGADATTLKSPEPPSSSPRRSSHSSLIAAAAQSGPPSPVRTGRRRRRRTSAGGGGARDNHSTAAARANEADAAAGGAAAAAATLAPSSFQQRVSSLSNLVLGGGGGGGASGTAAATLRTSRADRSGTVVSIQDRRGSAEPGAAAAGGAGDPRQRLLGGAARFPVAAASTTAATATGAMVVAPAAVTPDWRLRDRMKTVAVGLIVALNVGTDPPDLVRPHPCAVLQCWMDPAAVSRSKAKELIGERLQQQYAKWQLAGGGGGGGGGNNNRGGGGGSSSNKAGATKYRKALDPTVEDVRNLCLRLRQQAKGERCLLHYNGHGVPRPTDHGELWVFDKNHTEYIPLSVQDLRLWMGQPAIVVLDCSAAAVLVPFLTRSVHAGSNPNNDETSTAGNSVASGVNSNAAAAAAASNAQQQNQPPLTVDEQASLLVKDTIVLCPCSENEWLPMHPAYPADVFTSCLTTPIPMALRWFVNRNPASMKGLQPEAVDMIPGVANDRKTPLGELNWIFTAVTDSIAWNVLPKPLFQRLLRQDLLVASMFRNFLLADRILRSLGCTPVSHPPLPPGTAHHPLWQSWDLACETLLHQLLRDGILGNHVLVPVKTKKSREDNNDDDDDDDDNNTESPSTTGSAAATSPQQQQPPTEAVASTVSSPFFSEMLTAFEAWLEFSEIHKMKLKLGMPLESPEQLPVVLQVLLSPVHRIRALLLLRRFFDLGPWAVNLSLSLGIFPYVMKLLQSPEYKSLLISIWASILSFDPSCRVSVLRDGAFHHFVQHLMWGLNNHPASTEVAQSAAKERTLAAFVLAVACCEYPAGQAECVRLNLHGHCAALLSSYEQGTRSNDGGAAVELHLPAHFRLWLCLCLGNLVKDNAATQTEAYAAGVHHRLAMRLKQDPAPSVRAAVCYALGALIGARPKKPSSSRASSVQDLTAQQQQQQVFHQQQQQFSGSAPNWMSQQHLTPAPNLVLQSPAGGVPLMQPNFAASATGLAHLQPQPATLQPIPGPQQLGGGAAAAAAHQQQPMTTMQAGTQFWNPQAQQQQHHHQQQQHPQLQAQYVLHHHGHGPPGFMMGAGHILSPQGPILAAPQLGGSRGGPQPQFSLMGSSGGTAADAARANFLTSSTPTVYEDRHRLELDLALVELILGAASDGSVVVRYEATIALGGAVAKYLDAFVLVAEEYSLASSSTLSSSNYEGSAASSSIPLPRGLENHDSVRFRMAWKTLKALQREDPFPSIAQAANNIVSVVHENLLSTKMDQNEDRAGADIDTKRSGPLGGINEEPSPLPSLSNSPSIHYGKNVERGKKLDQADMRRVASEIVTGKGGGASSMEDKALLNFPGRKHSEATNYTLPKSEFYEWKKNTFDPNFQWLGDDDDVDVQSTPLDPLSPSGATRAYQKRRNHIVREQGNKAALRYANLAPKPPKPKKKSIEQMLEEEDESELAKAEEEASAKKRELEMNEKCLFRNHGVKMTSLISFHPYEDYLVACGVNDVFLWDTENGKQLSKFNNKNPKGSRITSACWVNEASSSLFLIGCDDGTVKIWGDLQDAITGFGSHQPNLRSAFQAAPMEAGHWGSGLVTEWQPFTGTLIAGGNSKFLCCWDLEAEKLANKIETTGDAYITTLTTAWDFERMGGGLTPQASQGIGQDIVVAGHSDGSLKIFDIRSNSVASEMRESASHLSSRRPRQRITSYSEHKSYVVTTAFTGYGGRNELISGTVSGEVKAWDLRMSSSTRTLDIQRSTMTTLALHPKIPVMATGSHAQFIKVATLDGDTMQVLRYHEKMANHRIGPVSCLAFHPFKPLLAAGATDSYVGLYTTQKDHKK